MSNLNAFAVNADPAPSVATKPRAAAGPLLMLSSQEQELLTLYRRMNSQNQQVFLHIITKITPA